jgi:hypothetical protein
MSPVRTRSCRYRSQIPLLRPPLSTAWSWFQRRRAAGAAPQVSCKRVCSGRPARDAAVAMGRCIWGQHGSCAYASRPRRYCSIGPPLEIQPDGLRLFCFLFSKFIQIQVNFKNLYRFGLNPEKYETNLFEYILICSRT